MYKLKQMAKRGSALAGAVSLLAGIGTSALPALASADTLNPLTERSLTLSSSSPGWSYLDGSGNTTYAPPNSGANGQKTGNRYTFRMSSDGKTVKAMTFQFCTTPAGTCVAPGDDGHGVGTGTITLTSGSATVTGSGTAFNTQLTVGAKIVSAGNRTYTVASIASGTSLTLTGNATATENGVAFGYSNADTTSKSDLSVHTSSPAEISSADWTTISGSASKTPNRNDSQGNFVVLWGDASTGHTSADTYSGSGDWAMSKSNSETGTVGAGTATGKNNFITITSTTGQAIDTTDYFNVTFFGTDGNYITNPGSGAFFVRINTYSDDATLDDTTLVDGGVTVANVMNESISIQTKVLETMDFSVGTHDPDTYNDSVLTSAGAPVHGQCNTLLMADPTSLTYSSDPHNVLKLGNPNAEYSLATNQAYDVNSYWRLSSNSSGGATVYYSGHTLTNTEGDQITPLDDTTVGGTASNPGTEQFGLAIAQNGGPNYTVFNDTYGSIGNAGDFADYVNSNSPKAHLPKLAPLVPYTNYGNGAGTITSGGTAKFAFNANADTYAIPIASESTDVVDCVTAKMRYLANIAATTPAGIYTTKVNYVASPQY
jgi:hypothetical protein